MFKELYIGLELDLSSSQWRLWLPVWHLAVVEVEAMLPWSINRLESSIAHNCCFRASCSWVQNSQVQMLVCSDLVPPSPHPVSGATVGSLTQDIWWNCIPSCSCCCVEELSTILWIWWLSMCSNSMNGREFGLALCSFSKFKIQGCWVQSENGVSKHGYHLFCLSHPLVLSSAQCVCFSLWCVHSAPYSLENLPLDAKLRFNESFLQHGVVQVLWAVLWLCRCLTRCPVNLWISCSVFPLSPLQLSERARERKVPVTRIGRLANFGGQFALPCLPWHLHGLWQGSCSAALPAAICHFSLLIGKCFPTNGLVSSELHLGFFIALKSSGMRSRAADLHGDTYHVGCAVPMGDWGAGCSPPCTNTPVLHMWLHFEETLPVLTVCCYCQAETAGAAVILTNLFPTLSLPLLWAMFKYKTYPPGIPFWARRHDNSQGLIYLAIACRPFSPRKDVNSELVRSS